VSSFDHGAWPDGVTLRNYCEGDLPFLISLRYETMGPHILQSGNTFDDERELARVLDRLDCARIITKNGEPIGLFTVVRDVDPWDLAQIQVAPRHQRCGIGRTLLTHLLEEARAANVGVALVVLKLNPARQLYERLGFRIVGTEEFVYRMRYDSGV
jgi:ribosomal protein S18 acetylase RimI-like enzyme